VILRPITQSHRRECSLTASPAHQHSPTDDVVFVLNQASAGYDGRMVLSGIDLVIRAGERVALMGRSGAGKSTLLGLLHAQRPGDIALVPQAAALVRPLSVFHNVYMGRLDVHSTLHNLKTLVSPGVREITDISGVLSRVGLADKIFAQAGALSGGQQQRTSVARALYNGRAILLGDEVVSALDSAQGAEVLGELAKSHQTMVLALHDVDLALAHSSRIIVLEQGRKIIDAASASLRPADLNAYFGGRV
jgi:phosphonate transport system ATP-binding protein